MPGGLDLSARMHTAHKCHSESVSWSTMLPLLAKSALKELYTHKCEDTGRSEIVFIVGIDQSSIGTL